jgi:prophage regulatory protein
MQQTTHKTIQLLRLPQVLERFPVRKSKWWAGVKLGDYPQPIRLGSRCTMWRAEDIDQLIDEVSKCHG